MTPVIATETLEKGWRQDPAPVFTHEMLQRMIQEMANENLTSRPKFSYMGATPSPKC